MFLEVVTLTGTEKEEALPAGLVDGDVGFAYYFELIASHDNSGRFVDADSDKLRSGFNESIQIVLAIPGEDVLVDGRQFEKAQTLRVIPDQVLRTPRITAP